LAGKRRLPSTLRDADSFADWFGTFAEVVFEIDGIEVAGGRAATVLTQRGGRGHPSSSCMGS
jgi:hypothetical protein